MISLCNKQGNALRIAQKTVRHYYSILISSGVKLALEKNES